MGSVEIIPLTIRSNMHHLRGASRRPAGAARPIKRNCLKVGLYRSAGIRETEHLLWEVKVALNLNEAKLTESP
jgi:hypothetical protein